MDWTTHTEAGGDTTTGEGGTPAFVSKKIRTHFFLLIILIWEFLSYIEKSIKD